jgi:hypothetical protein
MTDVFSERYGDLLTGEYDCVGRIVLNAYFPLGHSPGGFRVWWRRWHDDSDARLDNAHLMRLAGRFARRVRASAQAHGIPVTVCKAEERKHRIAEAPTTCASCAANSSSSNPAAPAATTCPKPPPAPSPHYSPSATRSSPHCWQESGSRDGHGHPQPTPPSTATTKSSKPACRPSSETSASPQPHRQLLVDRPSASL